MTAVVGMLADRLMNSLNNPLSGTVNSARVAVVPASEYSYGRQN